eukprot:CAMPEP_0119349994 /NCGR_PEP_ID=MMETSP1333-20130426/109833_1 /TAXON_ID=418940 /ORGANISM="Scyphosphaera apsteinii, Strain RCC1455" /LENGTH=219 /DNA_ID=CAMNT_0007362601 /DNA_START=427 /DNA_END=1086 /DNA_ORIENTATION=+
MVHIQVYLSELVKINASLHEHAGLHVFIQADGGEMRRNGNEWPTLDDVIRKAHRLDLGFASLSTRNAIRRENVCNASGRATGRHIVAAGREDGYFQADCEQHYVTPKRANFIVSARRIQTVPQQQWAKYYRLYANKVNVAAEGDKGENMEGLEHVWGLLFGCCWAMQPAELEWNLRDPWVASTFPVENMGHRGEVKMYDMLMGNFACYDRPDTTPAFFV